ncbi:MAG: DUF1461 domain-containing protein [Actinobacteria bacterium]|nr:DUF1461 domain-containing protein [Actinomycetota bacterium]
MKFLSRGLFLLSVVSLIVFLPATSVRLLATNYFLRYEFKKLGISQKSGLSEKELELTGNKILKFLTTQVSYRDTKLKLFNKREALHLYDVKGIFRKTFFARKLSGAYLVIYLLIILLFDWFKNRKMLKSFFIGSLILIFSIIGLFVFSFFSFCSSIKL